MEDYQTHVYMLDGLTLPSQIVTMWIFSICVTNICDLYFQKSWLGHAIPIFGDGKNVVPTIHIKDLARLDSL